MGINDGRATCPVCLSRMEKNQVNLEYLCFQCGHDSSKPVTVVTHATDVGVVTVTLQIGNSDDKLTQKDWSEFVRRMDAIIKTSSEEIHFTGGSINWDEWQNFCWVFGVKQDQVEWLHQAVKRTRAHYKQDSAAWLQGDTVFI